MEVSTSPGFGTSTSLPLTPQTQTFYTTTRGDVVAKSQHPNAGLAVGLVVVAVVVLVGLVLFLILWFTLPGSNGNNSGSQDGSGGMLGAADPSSFSSDWEREQLEYDFPSGGAAADGLLRQTEGEEDDTATIARFVNQDDIYPASGPSVVVNNNNESVSVVVVANVADIRRVNQFSFAATDDRLNCVLTQLAAQRIGIQAFWSNKTSQTCTSVRMIFAQTASVQRAVASVLSSNRVNYNIVQVLSIPTVDQPGQLARLTSHLSCRVNIRAVYTQCPNRLILDVSDVNRAHGILRNARRIRPCQQRCNNFLPNPCRF